LFGSTIDLNYGYKDSKSNMVKLKKKKKSPHRYMSRVLCNHDWRRKIHISKCIFIMKCIPYYEMERWTKI